MKLIMIGKSKQKIIRLSKSCLSIKEKKSVKKILDEEFLGMGPEVQKFEKELEKFFGRKVVCFNSGTAALQIALQASGIKNNDEVIVPSLTYVATYQAISATGAKPIICDINQHNLQISLDDIKRKISKKTKAIIPVHFSGSVGDLNNIYSFAKKNNLKIIEDAAHAFGTIYKNKKIGSFGQIACFSFDGIKNITSGEGGCLVTNDNKIIKYSKDARLLGVSNESSKRYLGHRSWISDVTQQGWRYHMSDINASIGRVQLSRFKKFSKIRKNLCKLYDDKFKNHSIIKTFKRDYNDEVPHIYVVRIKDLKKRELLRKELLKSGIQTGIHYYPGYKYTKYKKKKKLFPNTEKVYKELLSLPLHPDIKKIQIELITNRIKDLIKKKNYFS